jgi:hypothetical protein
MYSPGPTTQRIAKQALIDAVVAFSCGRTTEAYFRKEIQRHNAFSCEPPVDAEKIIDCVRRNIKL